MPLDPTFEKALRVLTRQLPALAAQLRQAAADAHAHCSAFNVASSACLDALLAFFREENGRQDPLGVFPPHIQTWTPQLDTAHLDELLVGHLLLERLLRCAFPGALRYNGLASQIARLQRALESCGFDQRAFLTRLDACYPNVEQAFAACSTRAERQQLLGAFCERFIIACDPVQAEEFSVIFTPQEIVHFMCAGAEVELQRQFGASLSSPGVAILDPAAGLGAYSVCVLGMISREMLTYKYLHEVFAIEVMLLSSYIARLNIEQAFLDLTGWYLPFPGLRYASALS